MAEFVEKRCEDMIPELEQMEKIKLFDKNEIRYVIKYKSNLVYVILILTLILYKLYNNITFNNTFNNKFYLLFHQRYSEKA